MPSQQGRQYGPGLFPHGVDSGSHEAGAIDWPPRASGPLAVLLGAPQALEASLGLKVPQGV